MTWLLEDPTPVIVACAVVEAGLAVALVKNRQAWLAIGMLGVLIVALGAIALDVWVVTDREQLDELFPRLARAVEQADAETVLAAIDPAMRPTIADAQRAMQQYRPQEITITDQQNDLHLDRQSPRATVDLIVRVVGNFGGGSGPQLVGLRVNLRKDGEKWLITDFKAERPDPLGKKRH